MSKTTSDDQWVRRYALVGGWITAAITVFGLLMPDRISPANGSLRCPVEGYARACEEAGVQWIQASAITLLGLAVLTGLAWALRHRDARRAINGLLVTGFVIVTWFGVAWAATPVAPQ